MRELKKKLRNQSMQVLEQGVLQILKKCKYDHCKEVCELHLNSRKCLDKSCKKRHINTCKYWYEDGCNRKDRCAYLHQETRKK